MEKENIQTQFENLLKTADTIADMHDEEKEYLTDEDIDKMIDALGEVSDPSQSFPSNNGVMFNENTDPSQNIEKQVLVSANPVTGVLNTIPYEEDEITEESLDKLLELKDEDLKQVELGWDPFVDTVKSMYSSVSDDDLKKLLQVVNKYRSGVKFSYFNEMPESLKQEIDEHARMFAAEQQGDVKQFRNILAKELFDTIITQNYSTKAFSDISKFTIKEINKQKEEISGTTAEYNTKLRYEYEVGFIEKAEKLEASDEEGAAETAEKLRKSSRMFTQSYTYEDMYEAYKNRKFRIKEIQVEKFNRTCQDFNRKYYNNTLKIRDIGTIVGTLDRVLDDKYNLNCIKKFVVAFVNYTRNFSPSNIDEHVFMFYFIQNILALDIKVPGNEYESFNELVKQNIYKFLDLIIERDAEKEELKKKGK